MRLFSFRISILFQLVVWLSLVCQQVQASFSYDLRTTSGSNLLSIQNGPAGGIATDVNLEYLGSYSWDDRFTLYGLSSLKSRNYLTPSMEKNGRFGLISQFLGGQYIGDELWEISTWVGGAISDGRDIAFSPTDEGGRNVHSVNSKFQAQIRKSWSESSLAATIMQSKIDPSTSTSDEKGNIFVDDRQDLSGLLAFDVTFERKYKLNVKLGTLQKKYGHRFSRYTDGSIILNSEPQQETETELSTALAVKEGILEIEPLLSVTRNKDRIYGALDSNRLKLGFSSRIDLQSLLLFIQAYTSRTDFSNFSSTALLSPSSGDKRADTDREFEMRLEKSIGKNVLYLGLSRLAKDSNYQPPVISENAVFIGFKGVN